LARKVGMKAIRAGRLGTRGLSIRHTASVQWRPTDRIANALGNIGRSNRSSGIFRRRAHGNTKMFDRSLKQNLSVLGAPILMALAACSNAAQAASYTMFRDPNCGCCEEWAEHVREGMAAEIAVQDSPNMQAIKDEHGVPMDLRSCHTMVVDGYVIEGHVPAADIARLLRERPDGIAGLAVPGMPVGSPGMEMNNVTEAYQVVAFGPSAHRIFSTYN